MIQVIYSFIQGFMNCSSQILWLTGPLSVSFHSLDYSKEMRFENYKAQEYGMLRQKPTKSVWNTVQLTLNEAI